MSVWFTSDLHIGHRLVAKLRYEAFVPEWERTEHAYTPEQIVQWHDEKLAAFWDRTVAPDDIMWVLGDISVGGRAREKAALAWVAARPGEKHLVSGNHDSCHPSHREAHKDQKRYLTDLVLDDGTTWPAPFASVQSIARRRFSFDGHHVEAVLSHFPYEADRDDTEPRDMQWRPRDEGRYLLHGHMHSPEKFNDREIHVGPDAWDLAPVPLETIADYIREQEQLAA